MKNRKRTAVTLAAVMLLSAGSFTAMAAGYESPADVAAGVTQRPVDEVVQEHFETGKTYGTIADEAGRLAEFKEISFDLKQDMLGENVSNGLLSQEEADNILAAIEARQSVCDGTGYGGRAGAGFGRGQGFGARGAGFGGGQGFGARGAGFGNGLCGAFCPYYN